MPSKSSYSAGRRLPRAIAALACAVAGSAVSAPAASAWTVTDPLSPARVAFVGEEDGDKEVFTMNADGRDRVQLTSNAIADCDPALSPDGKRIAWVTSTETDESELWVMNADGTGKRQVTARPGEFVRTPSWSPDGSTLMFMRSSGYTPSGTAHDTNLASVTSSDGGITWGAEQQFLATPARESRPEISPSGTQVAFVRDVDGAAGRAGWDVYVARIAPGGTGPQAEAVTQITATSADEGSPTWSPDETRLAYSRTYLHTYTIATRAEKKLGNRNAENPDWGSARNPDEIVFESYKTNWDLHRIDVRTGATAALTTSKAADLWGDW